MARFSQVPIKVRKAKEVASKVRKEELPPREEVIQAPIIEETPPAVSEEVLAEVLAPHEPVEPTVQWVEAEPGVYDIIVTCSCGERTVVRCRSVAPSAA
jgi:hypothetical protein